MPLASPWFPNVNAFDRPEQWQNFASAENAGKSNAN